MSRRIHSSEEFDRPLPWQIDVFLWFIGLLCVPFGMWWFTNEITSPATMLGEILRVPVNTQKFVEPFRPMIWIFGLLIGVRVRYSLRRIILKQFDRIAS